MSRCRIYLFTYKRNELLPRAIRSILDQTFKDWICELHNDDPEDSFPASYLKNLGDNRFLMKNHQQNLGPSRSFNLAFKGCEEDYATILEDDNWWEPDFLQEMISIMDQNPGVDVSWSNMRIWKQQVNGTWIDTGMTVWPSTGTDQSFAWPSPRQALGALHSNGAMIYRGKMASAYLIPDDCDFNIMEAVRERTFAAPLVLKRSVSANFAETIQTNRANDHALWTACQTLLLASFLAGAGEKRDHLFNTYLEHYRKQCPSPVINFYLANRIFLKDRALYRQFRPYDWFLICKWFIKGFTRLEFIYDYTHSHRNLYHFLVRHTANRHRHSSSNSN